MGNAAFSLESAMNIHALTNDAIMSLHFYYTQQAYKEYFIFT